MIAVTGAAMVLSLLPADSAGLRRALPSGVVTKTTRIGLQLALVGPILARSKTSRSRLSGTGLSCQPLWVRASRNRVSRLRASIGVDIGDGSWEVEREGSLARITGARRIQSLKPLTPSASSPP